MGPCDLNPNEPVDVVADSTTGGTDEGRAMLENIHDVAPGASLAFATAEGGDLGMANNIEALATTAKSNVIVDDVTYADEPFFQPGLISQAVDTVVGDGVTYFSSAGNRANDGYLSNFRATTGSITGIGSGTYMNFNPNGAANIEMPVTTDGPNADLIFEYDQPFATQQPAGSTAAVTSNVNIYVINATTGAIVVGTAANNNNVAIQEPWQDVTIPDAGSYLVAIQVVSGANPGHVEFMNINENVDVVVSPQYGSAGGTYYPSSIGHNATSAAIGVGATPWWAPAPYLGQNPLANEPFSSYGPSIAVLNAQGVALTSGPTLVQNPTITAPDGGNTSFFSPGQIIDTSNPPFPGEPATGTNLSQDLPSFFGTSSAAPNAAAVAALMLEVVPNLTPAQIRQGLISGATPMNGTAAGTWNPQSGFGEVNAINAINAVDLLRVVSTSPANGSTVTVSPSAITVTFNKPVNFSTVSAADLTFTNAHWASRSWSVRRLPWTTPKIQQSFSFRLASPGRPARRPPTGNTPSRSRARPITRSSRKTARAWCPPGRFRLPWPTQPRPRSRPQTTAAGLSRSRSARRSTPRRSTCKTSSFSGREPRQPGPQPPRHCRATSTSTAILRTTISYNPATFTVTLNYSALPQTEMPSDKYAIVVLSPTATASGVTDLVGNPLFGLYTGSFPTGVGETTPQDFIQNIGLQTLAAPKITTFVMTPTAANDTGIVGDQNTMITNPTFIGQIYAAFPGTVAGLSVYIEFTNSTNKGNLTLAAGPGGRGFTGTYTEVVTTDANGTFTATSSGLLQGFQPVVAVVVGQADQPPLPGLSSSYTDNFRIDLTAPQITGASFVDGGPTLPLPNDPRPTSRRCRA